MSERWTETERVAARYLASGSDESMRELLAELDRGFPSPFGGYTPDTGAPRRRSPLPRLLRIRSRAGRRWRGPTLVDPIVDGTVIAVALACVLVGARPLATSVAEARPALAEALGDLTLPSAARLANPDGDRVRVSASDRREGAAAPIGKAARDLDAMLGRYGEVAAMNAEGRLPCAQLRESYTQVEAAWVRYSLARRDAYSGAPPENVASWDATLYEAVREVDRGFNASGCRRP